MKAIRKPLAIIVVSAAVLILLSFFKPVIIEPKDIIGAWGYGSPENRTVMINTHKVFSVANYDLPGKKTYKLLWRYMAC